MQASTPLAKCPLGARSGGTNTNTRPKPASRPSRLQRPAACAMESSPAKARYTTGKSISTPASTSCVLTTRSGSLSCPSRLALRRALICSITALRCAPHISADRCSAPGGNRRCSSRAALRVLTMASAQSSSANCAAMSTQGVGVVQSAGSSTFTRLSTLNSASGSSMISRTFARPCRFLLASK